MAIDTIVVEVTPLAETIEVQIPGIPGPAAHQDEIDDLGGRTTALEGQSGSVSVAMDTDDFRSDYESVTLSPAMPDTNYIILTNTSDPELMGDAVAYDLATNGFKLRVTGSGGGTVTWRLLPL
jgi:hypothetical protein